MNRAAKFALRTIHAAGIVFLIPAVSRACSACAPGDPKTAGVYLTMTVIMSALPMLLVGGIGYWVYRRHS